DNSHFDFDILVTTAGVEGFKKENYVNFGAHTYILLSPGTSFNKVQARFSDIIKKYAAGNIAKAFAMPFDNFFKAGNGYLYYLQPLKKIHLISHLEGELKPNGSLQAVYIFGAIAIIILLLAIINFINLSTARSSERAKEVGIRKTFGSEKKALVIQFLTESLLISSFSLVLALALVYLMLPVFVQFTGASISFSHLLQPFNIFLLISLALITSLLAGLYPAFILSAFKPIAVLKGKFKNSEYGIILRNGLVIFQFAISVILIICTLIVNKQMNYMTGNSLGFNKEQTIILKRTDVLADKTNIFKDEIKAIPGVSNVTSASAFPGDDNYFGLSWRKQGDAQPMTGRGIMTDEEYAHTFDLQLKEGRYFDKDFGTDSLALILNESAVKELGLKEPIGSTLTSEEDFLNGPDHQQYLYTVVGVVKDYNYQSLHIPITPLVFSNISRFKTSFSQAIKLKPGNMQQVLKLIQQKWNQFLPDRPIDFEFLDQTIARQYVAETRTQKIFTFFSSLAIFIACIGLLGLAAYACQQRMKEISVRKILGASTPHLIGLLTISFLKSILVALVIGFPVAWFIMHRWLQDFSYRISITPWTFLLAGGIALGIALLTLSIQTIKAALSNPISTLRSE
ncbi:MAG: FtsX-like permease family protein, partial [Saprospiraceae bacterium]